MFITRLLSRLGSHRHCFCTIQTQLNKTFSTKLPEKNEVKNLGVVGSKYQVFRDEDSDVILDIYEQDNKYGDILEKDEDREDPFANINLERGVNGVFDIEDLVDVLRLENGQNIFVATVPKEIKYVDYICAVNGKSVKHMQAIAQFVRRVFKNKRHQSDQLPKIEGAASKDWIAIDLGNIALHIFSPEARKLYDLDSLWAVGPQYDTEYNKEDPIAEMLEKHSFYLDDLKPAS